MHDVERRDEIELPLGKAGGVRHLERDPPADARGLRIRPRASNRPLVHVVADDARLREAAREREGGLAAPAADVGGTSAPGERAPDLRHGGDPVLEEVVFVPGRGATLDRLEHLGRVLALRHTPAAPEGGEQLRCLTDARHDHLEEAADEERRVRIREHRRVLGWEDVVPALGTVEDVAGRGHGVQPLAEIAGAEARPGGERLDRHRRRRPRRPVPGTALPSCGRAVRPCRPPPWV